MYPLCNTREGCVCHGCRCGLFNWEVSRCGYKMLMDSSQ